MMDLVFIQYLFFLGLVFGLNFRRKVPLAYILSGSFLWGTVLFSLAFLVPNFFHMRLSTAQFIILLSGLILSAAAPLGLRRSLCLSRSDLGLILGASLSFFCVNLFFHTFNFSFATIDSFSMLMLGKTISFDGFNTNTLNSFTSWGLLVPIIQSTSAFLQVDYLVTLEVNFAVSMVALFFCGCQDMCSAFPGGQNMGRIIAVFATLILISTPIFLIQSVFIHTNLPAAGFFFFAILCFWKALKDEGNTWLVLGMLAMVGLSLSRTETFIYGIPVLALVLAQREIPVKKMSIASSIFFVIIAAWLMYLSMNSKGGTDIFDQQRIMMLLAGLGLLIAFFLLSVYKPVGNFLLPLLDRFFLLPFFALNLALLAVKPAHMLASDRSVLENMFVSGQWGGIFWLWLIFLVIYFLSRKEAIAEFVLKIAVSIVLIILAMGFFRLPYHLAWTDSANRLMTLIFPLILLFGAVSISSLFAKRGAASQIPAASDQND